MARAISFTWRFVWPVSIITSVRTTPVPFIVDDVLLSFDDERATAALSILNELSARTQIVFFTHHHHLVDLAKSATQAAVVEI